MDSSQKLKDRTIITKNAEIYFLGNKVFKKFFSKLDESYLDSYGLAQRYGLLVHEITTDYITTSTPRYKCSLLDHINSIQKDKQKDEILKFISKIIALVNDLLQNGLFHGDLAFRNICVDDRDDLHLIDFEELHPIGRYSNFGGMVYELEKDIKVYTGIDIVWNFISKL